MPSSRSTTSRARPRSSTTGCSTARWKARSSSSARSYCRYRSSVVSSSASREKPPSPATASAVASIDSEVHGSAAKLSSTQSSVAGLPPGAAGRGCTSSGPLLVRSAVTTSVRASRSHSTPAAAAARQATDVAHAWAICGPVTAGRPSRAAIQGAA